MNVTELMNPTPICCTRDCTAHTAANLLKQVTCGIVPVIQENSRRVLGIFTESDVCVLVANGCDLHAIAVDASLHPAFPLCSPNDDAFTALVKMAECNARGVAVVNDNNDIIGVVSLDNIANRVVGAARELYAALQSVSSSKAVATA